MTIVVSTDGSALGNPNGPMGWAWADHDRNAGGKPGHAHDDHGYDAGGATNGTNQIGELCAVLEALRAHPGDEPLLIESDSQYAINCSTKWVKGWKRNGWKNSQKKPVKNAAIIKAIDVEIANRPGPVDFKWVKGHAGNAGNELVDELARTYAGDCRSGARDGYLPIEGWKALIASEYADGLDVPPDVQLVLDGKADAESLRDDAHYGNGDAKPSPSTKPSPAKSSGTRSSSAKPSLAERLAEPEGVPDLVFDSHEAPTSPSIPAIVKEHAQTDANAGRTGQSNASATSTNATGTNTPTTNAAGGLRATGTIRITPPPSSSPAFHGDSITISGTISFTATVAADGTMHLDGPVTLHARTA
ncbi:ribonuclease H family protein [Bifidobacterium simiarum]|uniref:ribonuclease H family protein n=1 Tax=Bifidobacterium simiarum TaxID=2045441 RepID=UPI001BDD7ED4|nr:ribonuclease H [Bifidobacterium simiarum]MBT1165475.1 ribonuclease HI [Bifidobacterium simiarum]